MTAFRWIHRSPNENQNFVPVLLMNPQRRLDSSDERCLGYGLSFFDSLENAFNKHQKICRKPSLRKLLGEYIAEIALSEQDGVSSQPDAKNYGHFTFHACEETNLTEKIVTIVELFDEYGNYSR